MYYNQKKVISCIWIMLFVCFSTLGQEGESKNDKKKESIASFYKVVDGVNWHEYDIKKGVNVSADCYPEFKNTITNIPKFFVPRENDLMYRRTVLALENIQSSVDNGYFETIDLPGVEFPVRDRILELLDRGLTEDEFKKKMKGTGKENIESVMEFIHVEYNMGWKNLGERTKGFLSCTVTEKLRSRYKSIDVLNRKIFFTIYKEISIDCRCNENKNDKRLKEATATIETTVTASFEEGGLDGIIFEGASKPILAKFTIECCPDPRKISDDSSEDEKDNNISNPASNTTDKNCCANEMPKNSIDIIPGIALTNNFEDTSYDVAIRYMRAFGEFGKGNKVYGGAQVGYMSVQTQGGDVTQNMVYGGAIAENRIPILPCLNWSQGVSATYGSGSVENPATKDDFTQLSFGVHTGLNLQFNQQFAIGVDLNLIRFGTTTFTSEMGQEFEQEIGSLTFNKQMPARLGVRFSF